MTTEDRYGNPFDRYSSRTRRLNYHLPFWQHGQKSHKHGMNGAFIGREDILYRLRNWILSKSQTGSFLVAGYGEWERHPSWKRLSIISPAKEEGAAGLSFCSC